MRRIPKAFMCGSHLWTVKMVSEEEMDKLPDAEGCYGITYPDDLTIYLRKPDKNLKASIVRETFWHEYAHALLWTVLGGKAWKDEKVVTPIGHALKQFHDSKAS